MELGGGGMQATLENTLGHLYNLEGVLSTRVSAGEMASLVLAPSRHFQIRILSCHLYVQLVFEPDWVISRCRKTPMLCSWGIISSKQEQKKQSSKGLGFKHPFQAKSQSLRIEFRDLE